MNVQSERQVRKLTPQEKLAALRAEEARLSQILTDKEEGWEDAYWRLEKVRRAIADHIASISSADETGRPDIGEETVRQARRPRR